MPNVNRPFGLMPTRHANGGTPQRSGGYTIASGLNQALFRGDPVVLTGTGRNITIATAGDNNPVVGVFHGVRYVDQNGDQQFRPRWPAAQVATEIEAFVYDDANQEFIAQVSGAGGLAEGDVGANANLVAGAGNAFTGQSGWMVDGSAFAGTATFQVKVLGLARHVDNAYGQFAKARVRFNRHLLANAVAGV